MNNIWQSVGLRLSGMIAVVMVAMPFMALAAPTAAPPPAEVSGQGLEINPPLKEVSADPGQTITIPIKLRNISKGPLVVTGTADDFGAKGEDGEPQLLLDEKEATRYSLKFWVKDVPGFNLVPQEVKTAMITIAVPQNAEPGGHYGVIRFTGIPPELNGTGVSLTASLGALILLRVSGDINEKLSVADFTASKLAKDGKSVQRRGIFVSGPITLTERLRNEGSVHVKPVGYVSVYNAFNQRVAHLAVSNPARNVLPDSTRKFTQTWQSSNLFGRYTAQMDVAYGTNKKLSSQKISFWVIPYPLIISLIFILLILVLLIRWALKRYNRWIISQAKKP